MDLDRHLSAASTFADIVGAYRLYLRGDATDSPTQRSPIEGESLEILPALLELNAAGFLSVSSQPGMWVPESNQTRVLAREMQESGVDIRPFALRHEQRAYLTGFVDDASRLASLCDRTATDGIVCSAVPLAEQSSAAERSMCVTRVRFRPPSSALGHDDADPSNDGRRCYEWTWCPLPADAGDWPLIARRLQPALQEALRSRVVAVTLVDTQWRRKDHLFRVALDVFREHQERSK